ncbi:MAG: calcium/proton exchanger [Chloroflexota bacterium]
MQPESQPRLPSQREALSHFVLGNRLNLLLLFIPISIALWLANAGQIWVFLASGVAIIPLAALISNSTEQLGARSGPGIAGLLNATFGNATELVIAVLALREGLNELVKASISGSIIGNALLVLGLSMFVGGWKRERQTFNRVRAGSSAAMLVLSVSALVMPAVFDLTVFGNLEEGPPVVENISLIVAGVLMFVYLASLVFELRTHSRLFTTVGHGEPAVLTTRSAALLLGVATTLVALESEIFVGSIHAAQQVLGLSEFFIGIVIVAVVGNAAEHATAIFAAAEDKMELAMAISTGSTTQIALFVAPLLVFASLLFGHPMALVFNPFEIGAVTLATLILSVVILDGESNWFEGLQLLALYVIMAVVFYFVPAT